MSTTPVLQPASVINDLRTQIHLGIGQRLRALDLTPLLLRTVTSAPPSVLPYLLWELDVWDIAPAFESFGVSQQTIIQQAIYLHQIAGTPGAILYALALCGFPGSTILEGAGAWGGGGYPTGTGWAAFRVAIPAVLTTQQTAALTTIINYLKPARCVLDSIIVFNTNFSDAELLTPVSGLVYMLQNTPNPAGSLMLFVNGQQYAQGTDYTLSGKTVTFLFPLPAVATIRAFYTFNTPPTNLFYTQLTGANGIKKAFTLPWTPNPAASIEVYWNGGILNYGTSVGPGVDYTLSGAVVTLVNAPTSGTVLLARAIVGTDSTLGAITFAYDEVPTQVAGNVYSLLFAPAPASSLRFYRDSLLLTQGIDYGIIGNTITMFIALQPTDILLCYYRYIA